ncbi:MAG: DUF2269 domain-containing protein [Proteobacteria bacterium]|nr:DUF2269 domain-containing protein [Pseudomonadota bacterium]
MFDDLHEWLKVVHILGATVLLGTGLGTAFHLWMADRDGDPRIIAAVARSTVRADFLFIAPAAIVQPVTGAILMSIMGFDPMTPWLVAAYVLFALAAACWLTVVWLQIRVRDLAAAAAARHESLPSEYHRAMRAWFVLGWPAFAAVIVVIGLMVVKPELW